ncbi:UvrD-helicase domain-containing protein, partial [Candidatus Uhrbacteria bacterium]|nr:UvrD-helicase domain-containing protein [Candidatus Uhrbacteria bacterium]
MTRAKDENIGPKEYEAHVLTIEDAQERERALELAGAYHTYEQILHERNMLDFGGLLYYVLKLFEAQQDILEGYRKQFRHVLVDEFQDTNRVQYAIVKKLVEEHGQIVTVGDDDQAIYTFRGATMDNIRTFEQDFSGVKRIVLKQNYRSGQTILDKAYAFIQANNPHRFEAHAAGTLSKQLVSAHAHQGAVYSMRLANGEDEAEAVVKEIVRLHEEDEGAQWSDSAILVRANDHALPFLHRLEARNIPFHYYAMKGLYRKSVVIDALALLFVVDQPHDSVHLYRWLSHPRLGVDPMTLSRLSYDAKRNAVSLFDAIEQGRLEKHDAAQQTLRAFEALIRECQTFAQTHNALETLVHILTTSGFYPDIMAQGDALANEGSQYLNQLAHRARQYLVVHPDAHLHDFLDVLREEQESGEWGDVDEEASADPDCVRVLTVHSAKGLEFKNVFIVNLVDKRFPSTRRGEPLPLPVGIGLSKERPEAHMHLEEERRLFYVALTRAKERVYLTCADSYGGMRLKKPSPFFSEVHATVVRAADQQTRPNLFEQSPTVEATSAEVPLPEAFSFSQLMSYEHCPLQYKWAHVFRVPTPGHAATSFGKTMHATLWRFFDEWVRRVGVEGDVPRAVTAPPVSLEELEAFFAHAWIDEWYKDADQKDAYRNAGLKQLRAYYASLSRELPRPLLLEQAFVVHIDDIVCKGRIDRIDWCEDGVEIIDYKTGSPKTRSSLASDDKMQLLLYQLAAQEILGLSPQK